VGTVGKCCKQLVPGPNSRHIQAAPIAPQLRNDAVQSALPTQTLRALHRDTLRFLCAAEKAASELAPDLGDPSGLCTRPLQTPVALHRGLCDACRAAINPNAAPNRTFNTA
jgi:hypothetical protein